MYKGLFLCNMQIIMQYVIFTTIPHKKIAIKQILIIFFNSKYIYSYISPYNRQNFKKWKLKILQLIVKPKLTILQVYGNLSLLEVRDQKLSPYHKLLFVTFFYICTTCLCSNQDVFFLSSF